MTSSGPSAPAGRDRATGGRTRVAIVDDDTVLREGLPRLLTRCEPVLTARTVAELTARLRTNGPVDVVILDLNLNGRGDDPDPLHGRRGIAALTAAGQRCLVYTSERRRYVLASCYLAGALGVVHKTEPLTNLEDAVDLVSKGGIVVTTAIAGLVELVSRQGALPQLTDRQVQVLRARARGESFPSIGRRLGIAPKTAEEHLTVVARKFADLFAGASPADLERELGIAVGDVGT
jgi:DNA-binding NarL/FixJ family response regulator